MSKNLAQLNEIAKKYNYEIKMLFNTYHVLSYNLNRLVTVTYDNDQFLINTKASNYNTQQAEIYLKELQEAITLTNELNNIIKK